MWQVRWMGFFNITGPAATQITGWHSTLFILYTTARLHCVCLLRFTMLYFIACCSFSMMFSLRATMLINLNLNLNLPVLAACQFYIYTIYCDSSWKIKAKMMTMMLIMMMVMTTTTTIILTTHASPSTWKHIENALMSSVPRSPAHAKHYRPHREIRGVGW